MNVPSPVQPILTKVKQALSMRGANTLRSFARAFRNMDSVDRNNQLDQNEFITGLAEWGVQISDDDALTLMDWMDKDKSGTLTFDEFLIGLRGGLNEARMEYV